MRRIRAERAASGSGATGRASRVRRPDRLRQRSLSPPGAAARSRRVAAPGGLGEHSAPLTDYG